MGPIIGGVVGGVVVLAIVIVAFVVFYRKRGKRRTEEQKEKLFFDPQDGSAPSISRLSYELTPFVPPGSTPPPHPRESWSISSLQPSFPGPWSMTGQTTPDTEQKADGFRLRPVVLSYDPTTSTPSLPSGAMQPEVSLDDGAAPATITAPPAPITQLPQEDVERIIDGLAQRFHLNGPPPTGGPEYPPEYHDEAGEVGEDTNVVPEPKVTDSDDPK